MSSGPPAGLSAAGLLAELRTRSLGRALRILGETTSTIDIARDWIRSDAPDGGVVLAARQTHGRGRRARAWASPVGGLWMTIILKRRLGPEAVGKLGIGLALVAAEIASEETGCQVGVKWPNDVVLDGRKLGGVLVDAEMAAARVSILLLSLGLNVNIPESAFPLELRGSAVSLLSATGREYPLARFTARLLDRFESSLPAMVKDSDALLRAWRTRDVLLGKAVTVEIAGKMVRGQARGIDRLGRLVLSLGPLRRTALPAGEVTSVRTVAG